MRRNRWVGVSSARSGIVSGADDPVPRVAPMCGDVADLVQVEPCKVRVRSITADSEANAGADTDGKVEELANHVISCVLERVAFTMRLAAQPPAGSICVAVRAAHADIASRPQLIPGRHQVLSGGEGRLS